MQGCGRIYIQYKYSIKKCHKSNSSCVDGSFYIVCIIHIITSLAVYIFLNMCVIKYHKSVSCLRADMFALNSNSTEGAVNVM